MAHSTERLVVMKGSVSTIIAKPGWFAAVSATAFAAYAVAAGCTSERIVYRSGTNFPQPAAAAQFIGYYDAANKQTVCGSCHVDYQTR